MDQNDGGGGQDLYIDKRIDKNQYILMDCFRR